MNKLIKITRSTINGTDVNSVNARDLYKALEVKKAFTTWITTALDNAGAVDREDYIKLKSSLEGSGYQIDYIITADMSKHIAMMSKVPKAKEVRDYFIAIEKQATKPMTQIEIVAQTAVALAEQEKKLISIQSDVEEVKTYIDEDIKTRPVSYQQQKALQDAKMTKVYALGADDEALVKKLHSRVWSIFKKRFHLPRYAALPAVKFEDGLGFIRNLTIADMV